MKQKLNCILLIDDDEPTNFIHERVIRQVDCAHRIVSMQSGAEALEYLKSRPQGEHPCPDLIFLDINMPEMDGWEFLEEYAKLPRAQQGNIVVMMLTTSVNPDDEIKARQSPCIHDFLIKPLTREMMQDILQTYFPERL